MDYGIRFPVKLLDWKLTGVVWAWANDAEFAQLRDYTDASDGDIVRNLRQTIQLMRLVSKPLLELARGDLHNKFGAALKLVKRGLVDAEWQLRRAAELEAERIAEEQKGVTHHAPPDTDRPMSDIQQVIADEDDESDDEDSEDEDQGGDEE